LSLPTSTAGSTRRCTADTDRELIIQVILGSTRRERFSERAGEWVYERLAVLTTMADDLVWWASALAEARRRDV
jgi:hypothetical protein